MDSNLYGCAYTTTAIVQKKWQEYSQFTKDVEETSKAKCKLYTKTIL